jgi:hypothetical protein
MNEWRKEGTIGGRNEQMAEGRNGGRNERAERTIETSKTNERNEH